jgi:RNA recognition motif-containing protein
MAVRLFVGNLPYDVTETELSQLFSAAGSPSNVRLPTDRETGKPRGFAFVEFGDRSQAEEAIRRFNQQLFKGRPLAVNEARAREAGQQAARPAPSPRRPTSWSGGAAPAEDGPRPGQPRGTFGPDAPARGERKHKVRSVQGERAPKGPMRERTTGQIFAGDVDDDHDEDSGVDDFALWAQEKSGPKDDD